MAIDSVTRTASQVESSPTLEDAYLSRIRAVGQNISPPEIYETMQAVAPDVPGGRLSAEIFGEISRVSSLGESMYDYTLRQNLRLAQLAVRYGTGADLLYMGISWPGVDVAALEEDLQPATLTALDYNSRSVAAGAVAMARHQRAGFLSKTKVDFRQADIKNKADFTDISTEHHIAVSGLVAQYGGVKDMVDRSMEHARLAIHSDLAHGLFETNQLDFDNHWVEMTYRAENGQPSPSGFDFILAEEPDMATAMGDIYDAELIPNPDRLNSSHIYVLPTTNEERHTKVTIKRIGDRIMVLPWAYIPTEQATEEDMNGLNALTNVLIDTYLNDDDQTGKDWDGCAISGLADYAEKHGFYTVVKYTTKLKKPLEPQVPINILRYHTGRIMNQAVAGKIPEIGPHGTFRTGKEYLEAILKYSDPDYMKRNFELILPPLITDFISASRDIHDDLVQAA